MATRIFKKALINLFIFILGFTVIFFVVNILMQTKIKNNLTANVQWETNIFLRFFTYIQNIFNGSFGIIYSETISKTNLSIPSLFFSYFALSLVFCFISFFIALILGNVLGILSAKYWDKTLDKILSLIINILTSIPLIILIIVLLVFSNKLGFPSQYIINSKYTEFSILVPIVICFIGTVNFFFFKARNSYIDYINSEHYIFVKSLGLNNFAIFNKYIIKNLFLNQIKYLLPVYLILISVSLVVERIFNIPGQSILISFAYNRAEVDILMFFFTFSLILITVFQIFINIVVDILNPQQKQENNMLRIFRIRRFKNE